MIEEATDSANFGTFAPDLAARTIIKLSQLTPLGRGKLRRQMVRRLQNEHDGPLDTILFGLHARLALHNNSSETKALLKPSLYSRIASKLFRECLPKNNAVIIDVGANAGIFSLLAASKINAGHLIAIEPQIGLFHRLSNHLGQLNPELGATLRLSLFNCAVGAEKCVSTLNVPQQLGQASLHNIPGAQAMNVDVRTLVELVDSAEVDHIDVLKIDIEGFEDRALIPFFEIAPKNLWPRSILIEHCHQARWKQNCETYLVDRGYVVVARGRTDAAMVRPKL
ncbi:MAG: FkbM family methyltransferase [Pseudomonadota bacterium]